MVTQLALLGHGQVHGLNHLLLQVIELTVMTGTLAADCEALAAPRATPLGPKVGEIVVASFAEEEKELLASLDEASGLLDRPLLQQQTGHQC